MASIPGYPTNPAKAAAVKSTSKGDSGGPAGLGSPDSPEHKKLLSHIIDDVFPFLEKSLFETRTNAVRFWKLYLAKKEDKRRAHEKWRAQVFVPQPFLMAETRAQVLHKIILAADPFVQVEGVGDEDEQPGRNVEKLFDYQHRATNWRRKLIVSLRAAAVQGTEFYKLSWKRMAATINAPLAPQELEDFGKYMEDVQLKTGVQPPDWQTTDPAVWDKWRQDMMTARPSLTIPEPPRPGPKEYVQYAGPWYERMSMFEVYLDPLVPEIDDQPCIIHRIIKNKAYVTGKTGPEEEKPFDPKAVEYALDGWDGLKLNEWDTEIASKLGYSVVNENNPYTNDSVEILECWELQGEFKFFHILNRRAVITKNPRELPFQHGQSSIGMIRNLQIPGYALGMGEFQEPETLFYELNRHRELNLDATLLEVLPIFTKLTGIGLPDLVMNLRPGSMLPVSRQDAVQQLVKAAVPGSSWQQQEAIIRNLESCSGLGQNIQGSASTVGRVSATESQSRLQQAESRHVMSAICIEDELQRYLKQSLWLWKQYGTRGQRESVSGMPDALAGISTSDLVNALDRDFRFRGATKIINNDVVVQAMLKFAQQFWADMAPMEKRVFMKRIAETSGLRGVNEFVSDAGTQQYVALAQAQQQAAQNAQQQPAPPATVPVEQANKLAAGGAAPAANPQPGGDQGGAQ